jgi:uncharacterized membrane protein
MQRYHMQLARNKNQKNLNTTYTMKLKKTTLFARFNKTYVKNRKLFETTGKCEVTKCWSLISLKHYIIKMFIYFHSQDFN